MRTLLISSLFLILAACSTTGDNSTGDNSTGNSEMYGNVTGGAEHTEMK